MLPTINPATWSDWAIVASFVVIPFGIFHKRIRAWVRKGRDDSKFMDGVPAVRGVMEAVPSAPERLSSLEVEVAAIRVDVISIVNAVMGDGGLTEQMEKLFPNGLNTNNPGDLAARAAQQNGTWLKEKP